MPQPSGDMPFARKAVFSASPGDKPVPVESYTHRLQAACGSFQVDPRCTRAGLVRGAVQQGRIARFDAVQVSIDAKCVTRDARMIRRDPGEHMFMLFQQEGSCLIDQKDRQVLMKKGDIHIVDSTTPSRFSYQGHFSRQLSLHIPRDEVLRRLGTSCAGGVDIKRDDPLFPALEGVLTNLVQLGEGAEMPLAEALMNILAAYFHARSHGLGPADRKEDMLYQLALRCIGESALEPDFNINRLAAKVGISRRSLQRLFERNGDTVTARLLAARLDNAWNRLADQSGEAAPVVSVAYDCGFNDLSYFYRAFRARFGQTPGRVRKLN